MLDDFKSQIGELNDLIMNYHHDVPSVESIAKFSELVGQSNVRHIVSEDFEDNFDEVAQLTRRKMYQAKDQMNDCPIFGVFCSYIEVPGCEHKVQVSYHEGIGAFLWNDDDTEAFTAWFMLELEKRHVS